MHKIKIDETNIFRPVFKSKQFHNLKTVALFDSQTSYLIPCFRNDFKEWKFVVCTITKPLKINITKPTP